MPFQKGNSLGAHKNHKNNLKPERIVGTKWMQKDGITVRVAQDDIDGYMLEGWELGRPCASQETRQKQSASGQKSQNPGKWKSGHIPWQKGKSMPEYARKAMTAGRLEKYGVTPEQVEYAKINNLRWCSEHLIFEPGDIFTLLSCGKYATRCKKSHKKYNPEFGRKLAEQGGKCGLCKEVSHTEEKSLCVDHDHACTNPRHTRKNAPMLGCECTRSLLCLECNLRYGYTEPMLRHLPPDAVFPEHSWESKSLAYNLKWRTKPDLSYRRDNLSTFSNEKLHI